jgi:hypothetical protein
MFGFVSKLRRFEGKPTLTDENRTHFRDQEWMGIRKKVIISITIGGIAFMLWFLACLSYMYGTFYLSSTRHAALHVLAVNYDGGVVGQAMESAYTQLKGPSFLTLEFRSPEEYPSEADIYQAVRRGDYWASVAVTAGASERLSAALQGGEAAAAYDPSKAVNYVWNQQYYTTFANSIVQAHITQLVAATRLAYNKINGTQASQAVKRTDPAAIQALLNPIQASGTNIAAATFGAFALFSTISMAMPILQQFFFLLVLNGVLGAHNLYRKMTVLSSMRFRRIAGLLFTFGAALCQTGYYWAFREDWDVNGTKFVLTWLTIWLLMHIHLLILDSISTIAPLPMMPFVVLFWVLVNVASAASPLELQPGFYHWGIVLPSHEAYSVMVTVWTGGAHNELYRALPILFSWWIVGNVTATLTHLRACHLAYKVDREQGTGLDGGKDVESDSISEEEKEDASSAQATMQGPTTRLSRQRTVEEAVLERREVYGPGIPSLV